MMSVYVAGNLLGRLMMSYFIVWLVCVATTRGDWRAALRRTRRWYAIASVLIIFLAGLSGTLSNSSGA